MNLYQKIYLNHVSINAANTAHFKNMIDKVQGASPGVKPPNKSDIIRHYLDAEEKDMRMYIDSMKPC